MKIIANILILIITVSLTLLAFILFMKLGDFLVLHTKEIPVLWFLSIVGLIIIAALICTGFFFGTIRLFMWTEKKL